MTLKAIGKVNLSKPLQFTVVGTGPGGVAKVTGQLLAGGGQAGTNYVATVTAKKVKPVAAVASRTIVVRTAAKVAVPQRENGSPGAVGSPSQARPRGPLALARTAAAPLVLGVMPSGKSRGLAGSRRLTHGWPTEGPHDPTPVDAIEGMASDPRSRRGSPGSWVRQGWFSWADCERPWSGDVGIRYGTTL